jgi:predicted amino acid racemase
VGPARKNRKLDFLETTMRRNPKLIESAFRLHEAREIPSNVFLVDMDAVGRNAKAIADSAKSAGLTNYFMTKQFGRNPLLCQVIVSSGIASAVAIDIEETKTLHRNGFLVGHVGHLVQVPTSEMDYVIREVRPEVVTVYSHEKAEEVNRAAHKLGIVQKIMLRPIGLSDSFSSISEGGTPVRDLIHLVARIGQLKNISLSGLTSFPSFRYDLKLGKIRRTANFETLLQCKRMIENTSSVQIEQINAPGSSCAAGMSILAKEGATHAEPGHAFTGTTPWHAFHDLDEIPAWVYVTEVSHAGLDRAYTFSGGLPQSGYHGFFSSHYHQNFMCALVSKGGGHQLVLADPPPLVSDVQASPDYYTSIRFSEDLTPGSGDTVVFGFRPQVYVSRSKVAIVKGIGTSHQQVLGIFDRNGNLLRDDESPAGQEELLSLIRQVKPR